MGLKRFFEPRLKLWDHMVQLILILIAISLTGAHMNLGVIYGRPEIMTIAMVSYTKTAKQYAASYSNRAQNL